MSSQAKASSGSDIRVIVENPQTVADMRANGVRIGEPVRHEDHEGIAALYRIRDEANAKGDWALLDSTEDMPMMMLSDSSSGDAVSWTGTAENSQAITGAAMRLVPKGPVVKHERRFVFITEHLAVNLENNTVTVGEEQLTFRAAHLVVKRNGQWRVKVVVEGGWGDIALLTGCSFEMGEVAGK